MASETRSPLQRPAARDARVIAWRREQLRAAGFAPDLAGPIAREWLYDLHALIELVERGCPPRLAARILAPLDGAAGSDRPRAAATTAAEP
jgi:hypothetical protein